MYGIEEDHVRFACGLQVHQVCMPNDCQAMHYSSSFTKSPCISDYSIKLSMHKYILKTHNVSLLAHPYYRIILIVHHIYFLTRSNIGPTGYYLKFCNIFTNVSQLQVCESTTINYHYKPISTTIQRLSPVTYFTTPFSRATTFSTRTLDFSTFARNNLGILRVNSNSSTKRHIHNRPLPNNFLLQSRISLHALALLLFHPHGNK